MANPIKIIIKESITELKALKRKHGELIGKRIQILIELKKNENTGVSKRNVSDSTGINHNTVLKWRKIYDKDGIAPLLVHNRKGGYKKSVFTEEEHNKIELKLNDPENGIVGFQEFKKWIETELKKEVLYITVVKYLQRKFNAKLKVGRKSHIKKDDKAVEVFKKTSV